MAVYFPPDGANFIAVAGSTAATYDTILFSNQNGITFGLNGSVLTASHNGLTGHTGPTGIAVAGSTLSDGTLQFSNANNITFGMNGSTITASYGGAAAGGVAVQGSGTYTQNSGTIQFANSNGITFGLSNNGAMTASYEVSQLTAGNNVAFSSAGSTLTIHANAIGLNSAITANGVSATMNTSGLSLNFPAFLTNQTVQPVAYEVAGTVNTFGTLKFANSNGLTWSTGTQGVYVTGLGAGGGGVNVAAGGVTQGTGTVNFANSNGMSFGLSANGAMTGSYEVSQMAPGNNIAFSTGGSTVNIHANAVGLNSGITNGLMTLNTSGLSLNFSNHLTTQTVQPVAYAVGGTTNNFSTIAFVNANGVSWSTSTNGIHATVATNYLPLANSNNYFYTSNNTFANNTHVHGGLTLNVTNLLTSITSNSNGLTININNSNTAYIPLANSNNYFYTSNNTFANSTHSHGNPTLALTGLLGTTASNSAGFTLSLSNNAAGGVAIAAGSNGGTVATTLSTGTIQFANSNGVTFGLSNNGVMTASVQAGAGAGVGAVGIGASSLTSGTLVFANTGNVTFGWNGSTITASAPAGGGAAYSAYFACPPWQGYSNNLISNVTATRLTQRPLFFPFEIGGGLTAGELHWPMSRATSGSNAFTVNMGIYSFVNSSQIGLIGSNQNVFSATATASISGVRMFEASLGTNFSTLPPGQYVLGLAFSAAATASMNYSLMGAATNNPPVGVVVAGSDAYHTYTSHQAPLFWGIYTATSSVMPGSVGLSQISANINSNIPLHFTLGNHV